MTDSIYGQQLTYVDNTTFLTAPEVAYAHGIADQPIGTALATDNGILDVPGGSGFEVTIGTGLSVNIAAGEAKAAHDTFGSIFYRKGTSSTLAVTASSTLYICIVPSTTTGATSQQTAAPVFTASDTPVGLVLALVKTGVSSVTSTYDRRHFINPLGDSFGGDFSEDLTTTDGLTVAFNGGTVRKLDGTVVDYSPFTVDLTASDDQYIEIDETGTAHLTHTGFSATGYVPLWHAITDTDTIVTPVYQRDKRIGFDFAAAGSATVDDASTTVKGVSKLSVAPVGDPIAVGDNDPRNTDARTPTTHASTHATGGTDAIAPADIDAAAQSDFLAHTGAAAPHIGHFDVDGSKPLTGDADAGGNTITNLATPTASTDAVTKAYADALASGLSPKANVKAATTTDITLSGAQTIDSVSVVDGDRTLVKDQITQSENGIYIVGTPWVRASDADTSGELPTGSSVTVLNGSANKNRKYIVTTAATTLDTDPIVWGLDSVSSGEANILSNQSTDPSGVSIVGSKTGVALGLFGLVSDSTFLTIVRDAVTSSLRFAISLPDIAINSLSGILGVAKGGTGKSSITAGALLVGNGTSAPTETTPNTTATKKYLYQQGDGTNVNATGFDVPTLASLIGHSTSSVSLATGSRTFTVEANLGYSAGQRVRASSNSDASAWIEGTVTSYGGTTLIVNVDTKGSATGSKSDWTINVAGQPASTFIPLVDPVRQNIIYSPQAFIEAGYLAADAIKTGGTAWVVKGYTHLTDLAAVNSKWITSDEYQHVQSALIPVTPGETLNLSVSFLKAADQSGVTPIGYGYLGLERYDKDGLPIAANNGTVYITDASGYDVPADGAIHVRTGTLTMPTSHTPYSGSDGGGVRYVRVRWLTNFNVALADTDARAVMSSGDVKVWRDLDAGTLDGHDSSYFGTAADVATNTSAIAANISALALKAPLASPAFTGVPTVPTASAGTNNTQAASTAYTDAAIAALVNSAPSILDTLGEIATQLASDESTATALATTVASKAPLASPALTGVPTAPTASAGNNSTQLATTAYADSAVAAEASARSTADALKAPLASPTFTGTPAAPTASAGNNSTQLATTAYVDTADALKAPLASPALTGTPTAPTATAGTNTTQIASTAFVTAAVAAGGGGAGDGTGGALFIWNNFV